jgi:hypothetical protein
LNLGPLLLRSNSRTAPASRPRTFCTALVWLAGLCLAAWPGALAWAVSPIPNTSTVRASGRWRDASIDDYRRHLGELTKLVNACARTRDLTTCDPLLVGPDDRIPLGSGANAERRQVRYGWLRVLFSKAEEPDTPPSPKEPAGAAQLSTSKLLLDAEQRLASDLAQTRTATPLAPGHAAERAVLVQVLAGRDFRDLQQPSPRDSMLEKVNNWLNHLLENVTRWRARSAWIGRLLVWGFILIVCVALIWGLLQMERRWRVRLVPEERVPASAAPSARNWQLWLEDARRAAAAGQWREAIHLIYWAAIARLEARRLWPADRARTPREYLALLAAEDPRRARLAALTSSFERIWYGGRAASESDYRLAEEIAAALIEGGSGAGIAAEGRRA